MSASIGVAGAGAWGTALAQMLAADGREVTLWAREPELVEEINTGHTNSLFLPTARLAPSIRATGDLAEVADCDVLLLVTPAQHLADTMARMPKFPRDLVLCAKGIEAGSGRLMHRVAADAAPACGPRIDRQRADAAGDLAGAAGLQQRHRLRHAERFRETPRRQQLQQSEPDAEPAQPLRQAIAEAEWRSSLANDPRVMAMTELRAESCDRIVHAGLLAGGEGR